MKKSQVNKIYNYFANNNQHNNIILGEKEIENSSDENEYLLGIRQPQNFLNNYDWLRISIFDIMTCHLCITYSLTSPLLFIHGIKLTQPLI